MTDITKEILKAVNTGKSYPAIRMVKDNPELAAAISKLHESRDGRGGVDISRGNNYSNINQNQVQTISNETSSRIEDNENIIQLFPDIELAIQILVSSILSPKDMIKTEILYKARESIMPIELSFKLNSIVRGSLDDHYNLRGSLPTILREVLFDSGSYVKVILPEGIVDEVINSGRSISTESMQELYTGNTPTHLNILGNPGKSKLKVGLEMFSKESYREYNGALTDTDSDGKNTVIKELKDLVDVSDNYKLLKLPSVIEANNQQHLKSVVGVSLESLENKIYKTAKTVSRPFLQIPKPYASKRKSIGRPLVLKIPSESVIPVCVPGSPANHVGYFIVIDVDGNPVTAGSNKKAMGGLNGLMADRTGSGTSLSSMLIKKAENNLSKKQGEVSIDNITKIYSNIIEKDLLDRLKNGLYSTNLDIGGNDEIYRIMLARAFANQYTRLVYVPEELVTYYAFKYFKNGVGKSYLDDIKVLSSLRAILLFSKVMAMTKNSIAMTRVNMTLDPLDPDPQKSIEIATHEIGKVRQLYFPLGINNPVDLVNWVQRAGIEFAFEGHPGLPQMKFDTETKSMQHILPDNDLDELLRKQTHMTFGLSPETIDNGFNQEFATTVISNNILFSKRVAMHQETFIPIITKDARRIIKNDTTILSALIKELIANKDILSEYLSDEDNTKLAEDEFGFLHNLTEQYIDNLELDLPRPDITALETQSAAFTAYKEALEVALDSWISAEFVSADIAGDISTDIDTIKAVLKSYYLRTWMADNNYMPELADITGTDETGKPILDLYNINEQHVKALIASSLQFVNNLHKIKTDANDVLKTLVEGDPASTDEGTDSPDTELDSTDDDNSSPDDSDNSMAGEDMDDNAEDGKK